MKEKRVEFKLLGPLEVVHEGRLITPTAPKLRRVLALLVLRSNQVVTFGQVIEELWDQRPPNSASTTMQTYIYQIRKIFRMSEGNDGESVSLRTTPGGYILSVPPEKIDVNQFDELLKIARGKSDEGDLEAAAELYREALQIWRGPALSDISLGTLLQAETVRLEEVRKSALEQLLDLYLELGRHKELISELLWLTSKEPTHEGFFARLMIALARTGRRTEALSVYHRCRRNLIEQLGLEPSAELQELQHSLLASDTAAREPQPIVAAQRREVVARTPRGLIGRGREYERIVRELTRFRDDTVSPVVLVTGPAGVGKTALALAIAQEVAPMFPDGRFLVDLECVDRTRDEEAFQRVLDSLLTQVGLRVDQTAGVEGRLTALRDWTRSRRALFVVDNAVDLAALLPAGSGCAALVLTRHRTYDERVTQFVELAPLSISESVELLTSVLGADRAKEDLRAAEELAELCEGLPAALRAVAIRLATRPHWTLGQMVLRLRDQRWEAVEFNVGSLNVLRSIGLTVRSLSSECQDAFVKLALRAEDGLTIEEAASVLDTDVFTAEEILERLVEAHLAVAGVDERHESGTHPFRYRFSRLHALAARTADAGEDADSTISGAADERSGLTMPGKATVMGFERTLG